MRLSQTELEGITGRTLPAVQARWFKKHLGVDVAYDRKGPIITKATFEALVAKKYGISGETVAARPTVKREKRAWPRVHRMSQSRFLES